MSEQAVEPVVEAPVGGTEPEVTPEVNADNPAWSTILNVLPESLYSQVKPVLREWDQGINGKFQEIHQTYEPYKQFLDAGISAEQITQAYQLMQALDTDPRGLYDRMGSHYGYVGASPLETPGQPPAAVPSTDPQAYDFGSPEANAAWQTQQNEMSQMRAAVIQMGQIMMQGNEQAQQAQNDSMLDQALESAKEKYGDFNENIVLSLIAQGVDPDQAVQTFRESVNAAATAANRPEAPIVMSGAGGALPTPGVDPTKLDDKGTKNLIVQMLANAKASG